MKIKKFQKIICLGLALLSIMVLPCYADEELIIRCFESDNDINGVTLDIINEPTFYNYLVDQGIIKGYKYIGTIYNDNNYNYYRIISNKSNITFLTYSVGISNQILYDSWYEPRNAIPSINYGSISFNDEEFRVKLYNINLNSVSDMSGMLYSYDFYKSIIPYEYAFMMDNIIVISPIENAVINITTYTNLLIQNFGKAFTFMTGPALPWVLLGISVSLISFGVYSAKRFL